MPKTTVASHFLMHSVAQSDSHPHREVESFDEASKARQNPQPASNPQQEAMLNFAKQKGDEQTKMLQDKADRLSEAMQKGREAANREEAKQQEKLGQEAEARQKQEKDLEQERITGEQTDATPKWRQNADQKPEKMDSTKLREAGKKPEHAEGTHEEKKAHRAEAGVQVRQGDKQGADQSTPRKDEKSDVVKMDDKAGSQKAGEDKAQQSKTPDAKQDKSANAKPAEDKSQQNKAGDDKSKQVEGKPAYKSAGTFNDNVVQKDQKDDKDQSGDQDAREGGAFSDQVKKMSDAMSKGREAAARELQKNEAQIEKEKAGAKQQPIAIAGKGAQTQDAKSGSGESPKADADLENSKKQESSKPPLYENAEKAGQEGDSADGKSAGGSQQKNAQDSAQGGQNKADQKEDAEDQKPEKMDSTKLREAGKKPEHAEGTHEEKKAHRAEAEVQVRQGDKQGADQSTPRKDEKSDVVKMDDKAAKKDDAPKKAAVSPKQEREERTKRAHELHPQFYEEIARRRAGKTPMGPIESLADIERPHNEEFENDNEDALGELELARKAIRQNEFEWRDRQKDGLNTLHRIQQWQEREIKEADYNRESRQQDQARGGIFGSVSNFVSSKWHNLTQGKEKHNEKDLQDFDVRREERDDRRTRRSTQATPPTTPMTPASGRRALSERQNQKQDSDDRFDGVDQTRQTQNNKQSGSWFFGNLQHFAPQWNAKENTRFIDSLTDDELSMMSL